VLAQLGVFDPGNVYGVPYMWGTTGIALNVDMIKARLPDASLDSWTLIFDSVLSSKLENCGIALVDNSDAVVMAALFYLGRDPNSGRMDELKEAIETIKHIQPFVRYFHSSAYVDDLANGEICLALGYSGDVYQAMRNARSGVNIEYRIPKEGAAVWIDVMAIPKDAPHPENAVKWIDHILDPTVVAGISNAIFYANPNSAAKPLLDPAIRDNPTIYPSNASMKRLVVVKPQSQSFVRARNRGWTRAKAGV
jgi:putrescine transport system substrate-binding protein